MAALYIERDGSTYYFPNGRLAPKLGSRASIRLKTKKQVLSLREKELYGNSKREGTYRYVPYVSRQRSTGKTAVQASQKEGKKQVRVLPRDGARNSVLPKRNIKDWSIEVLAKGRYFLVLCENMETGECLSDSKPTLEQAQSVFGQFCQRAKI